MQVWPTSETAAKFLKHPRGQVGFRSANDPAEWPDDSYTARRLRDGDISLTQPVALNPPITFGSAAPTSAVEGVAPNQSLKLTPGAAKK